VLKIAKDQLYTGVFTSGVYFNGATPVDAWTTYKPLLDYINRSLSQIVPDSPTPAAGKFGASQTLGAIASRLYFLKSSVR